jgi:RNA polymerase sigma-70 factor (ECF subfamily)
MAFCIKNWFEKAKKKDETGLTTFYHLYAKELFAFILKRVSHYEDAEDILSLTLEKIFFNFHKIFSMKTLNSYIYKITKNVIFSYYRKKKQKKQISCVHFDNLKIESTYDTPYTELAKKEEIIAVRSAMLKLPAREFEVLKLFYDQDKSIKEIAGITGSSARSVESLLYRGRKRLKKLLNC